MCACVRVCMCAARMSDDAVQPHMFNMTCMARMSDDAVQTLMFDMTWCTCMARMSDDAVQTHMFDMSWCMCMARISDDAVQAHMVHLHMATVVNTRIYIYIYRERERGAQEHVHKCGLSRSWPRSIIIRFRCIMFPLIYEPGHGSLLGCSFSVVVSASTSISKFTIAWIWPCEAASTQELGSGFLV